MTISMSVSQDRTALSAYAIVDMLAGASHGFQMSFNRGAKRREISIILPCDNFIYQLALKHKSRRLRNENEILV